MTQSNKIDNEIPVPYEEREHFHIMFLDNPHNPTTSLNRRTSHD
jgi:hypothetical protein